MLGPHVSGDLVKNFKNIILTLSTGLILASCNRGPKVIPSNSEKENNSSSYRPNHDDRTDNSTANCQSSADCDQVLFSYELVDQFPRPQDQESQSFFGNLGNSDFPILTCEPDSNCEYILRLRGRTGSRDVTLPVDLEDRFAFKQVGNSANALLLQDIDEKDFKLSWSPGSGSATGELAIKVRDVSYCQFVAKNNTGDDDSTSDAECSDVDTRFKRDQTLRIRFVAAYSMDDLNRQAEGPDYSQICGVTNPLKNSDNEFLQAGGSILDVLTNCY